MQDKDRAELAHNMLSTSSMSLLIDDVLAGMDITHATYRAWLHQHNFTMPLVSPQLVEEIRFAREIDELSTYEVAKLYHISTTTISAILVGAYDAEIDHKALQDERLIVDALRKNVDTQKNLAKHFDTTPEHIQRIRRKYSIAPARKARATLSASMKQSIRAEKGKATVEEVMRKYDVSRPTVFNIWRG